MQAADLDGAAHRVLDAGVMHLDPATAVFDAMLAGWKRQQQSGSYGRRRLRRAVLSVSSRLS
jgi:hypothetical protein